MSAAPLTIKAQGLGSPPCSTEDDFPNLRTVYHDVLTKTITAPPDPTPAQRIAIVEVSGTLDFWDHPEEDIYSEDDGTPV